MQRFYWINLIAFILLLVVAGLFRKEWRAKFYIDISCSDVATKKSAHAFLCDQKVKLTSATTEDLQFVPGVSLTKARAIKQLVESNPQMTVEDLVNVKGIGPKTVEKLARYFF